MRNEYQLRESRAHGADWKQEAECRKYDTELFYYPFQEGPINRKIRAEKAKQICAKCTVIDQCREYALNMPEVYGVWGGTTEKERQDYLSRMRNQKQLN